MKGSTIKRGHTYTAYWFTTDLATGKRRQHSKGGFRIQRDARAHLNSIMEAVSQGAWRPDAKLTIKALLVDHWLPAKRSEGLRPATISLYRNAAQAWILPHIGELDVRQLTPARAAELTDKLRTSGSRTGGALSSRSTQLALTVLKSATSWAMTAGLLGRDPLTGYKRPRSVSAPMSSWSIEEARAFLKATGEDRMAFAWGLLLTRGLRRGELCGLRWADVDLDGGVVRINRTRVLVDGKAADSLPKTAAGRRSVPLDPTLVALLRRHKARQAAEKLAAGGAYQDGGWLVADELGRPWYPDTVSERFADLVKAAGLRRIRLHDTRHTAASLMLASGVPV